ncbi:MAG: 7-cyano-7-deazaguanine synthase QueC [Deltaproteobacteria bacterium]|nr:7-cyano-7-deazaguanine synthase QueC [Deltaproteobacteria bacterium]
MKALAIVLVSGGLDSCVTAAVASKDYELAFLHVNYGQRTEARELRAFKEIADFYGVSKRFIASIDYLKKIGGSSLIDKDLKIPDYREKIEGIPSTYVPFRNTHLIAIAVSWAEVICAKKIFIGAMEEDSSGYPDCREVYFRAYNQLIDLGTRPETRIEIETPIIHLKKWEVVKLGAELGAPLHLTWSCYRSEDIACGRCESCILRLKAFRKAGIKDPIAYQP